MRLTPLEIQNMTFAKRRIGGVDSQAVHDFLEKVAMDYEALIRENRKLQEELRLARDKMDDTESIQSSLKEAMLSAQKATGVLKANAIKESRLLLKESELKAERMLDDAKLELKVLQDDVRNYKNMKRKLKTELKTFLQSYIDLLDESEK